MPIKIATAVLFIFVSLSVEIRKKPTNNIATITIVIKLNIYVQRYTNISERQSGVTQI